MKNIRLFWLRVLVGVVIILTVLYAVDFQEFPRPNEVKTGYLMFAALLVLGDRFIGAWKWKLLIIPRDMDIRFNGVVSIYFKSLFLGLIIPSSAGGEILKGYGLVRCGSTVSDSFSSVVMERTLGFVALGSVCLASGVLLWEPVEVGITVPMGNVAIISFLVTALVMAGGYFLYSGKTSLVRIPAKRLTLYGQQIRASFCHYRNSKTKIFVAIFLSFAVQFIRIIFVYLVGKSVGITLGLQYYFVFVPIVALASVVPLSVAGVGVQEGAFVYLFGLSGTSPAQTLGMAVLVRLLIIASVLPGAVFYLKEGLNANPRKAVSQS